MQVLCARGLSGAPTELFTGSAESDLLTIWAYAAAVYRAVSDTAARLSYNKCKCVFFWSPQPPQNRCTHTCSCTYILARRQLWLQYLLGGRVYWACRKRTVETAMLVCAYTKALHAPGDGMWDNKWTTLTDDPPNTNRLYKKAQPLLPAPAWLTGRVGNNRASTVDVDICRQSRGRGTHTALAKALHAPFPEHPPGQLRK